MAALHDLVAGTERIFRVSCRFRCDPPVHLNENKTATQLYRIAQEAVGNAIKHSHADRIEINLALGDGMLQLTIRDNGIGIPDHSPRKGTGMGLYTMSHRAKMLGGSLHVGPDVYGGTVVQCTVPMPDSNHS
jgi:two-component system sensor kinase FixL